MNTKYIDKFIGLCEEGTVLVSKYKSARDIIELVCKNGHTRTTTSNSIVSKGGGRVCKECLGITSNGKKSRVLVEAEFLEKGFTLIGEYIGALNKTMAKNNVCGHEYLVVPSHVHRGRSCICPVCYPSRRLGYTEEDFSKEIEGYGLITLEPFINFKTNIKVQNKACEHEYYVNPGHLLYDKIGIKCTVCTGQGDTRSRFFTKLIENNMESISEYTTTQNPISIRNNNCAHEYSVIPNNLVNAGSGLICRICHPTDMVSKEEISLYEYITSIFDGWIIQSERQILNDGKELDIVLPDLGIAIEYNGSKWHSDITKPDRYHLDKTEEVESYGYTLIHIMDTEWKGKPEIVKSRLRSIILKDSTRIFARKTEIREIPFPREFLNTNHIQGAGSYSKYNYGLFFEDKLVAVMTFSKPRFNKGFDYELIRYCSILNTSVIGGASKLLKTFRDRFSGSIISYADRRWSKGNLYKQLGFEHLHNSAPNYKYYKYKECLSRYQCQKHLLKDMFPNIYSDSLSEREIMIAAGYHKVFDCGNSVWVLKI